MATLQSLKDQGLLVKPGDIHPAVLIVPCQSKRRVCVPDFHAVGALQVKGPNDSWVVKEPNGRFTCVPGTLAISASTAVGLELGRPCRKLDRKPLGIRAAQGVARSLIELHTLASNPTEATFRRFWECEVPACKRYRFDPNPVPRRKAQDGDVPLVVAKEITAFFRDNFLFCNGHHN